MNTQQNNTDSTEYFILSAIVTDTQTKFRAWNTETSRMLDWETITNPSNNEDKNGLLYQVLIYGVNQISVIPLQYTGVSDKKGVEIYEGDILKCSFVNTSYDEDDDIEAIQKWIDKTSYVVRQGRGWWVRGESFGYEGEELWNWEIAEVIGNIFEHSHLLETT